MSSLSTTPPEAARGGRQSTSSSGLGQRRNALDVGALLARLDAVRPSQFAIAVLIVYFGLALAAYFPTWPGDPHRLVLCACGDSAQQSWFLLWTPWALIHGHNPLFTSWMDFPIGANLAQNTEMPLLGLLTAPLSLTGGSVASFGLLLYLAFPLSATSAFFVLRRFTRSNVAAAAGGLLYGFSSYIVGEGLGHLNLAFVPLPPLIFLCAYEILVAQRGRARDWGIGLGVAVTAQFLISPEVLSTTAIVTGCGAIIIAITRRRELTRARLRYATRALVPAVAIAAVFLCYPIWFLFEGPLRFHGAVQGITNPYRADLLGTFVPTSSQRFAPAAAISLGDRFAGAVYAENGSYVGIPLLLLAGWCLVRFRHNRWIVFSAAMALIAFILSLGPQLMVAGHLTPVRLPFDLIGRLPLLWSILPSRFSLYETFFLIVIVCLALSDLSRSGARRLRAEDPIDQPAPVPSTNPRQTPRRFAPILAIVLVLATVVSLIPRWPLPTVDTATEMPPFFTSAAANQIPENSIVLSYPFSVSPANEAMLWQETNKLRWRLVGGYALIPNANGSVSPWPPSLQPVAVQEFLGYEAMGPGGYLSKQPIPLTPGLVRELRTYIAHYDVQTVIFDPVGSTPAIVLSLFEKALGQPTTEGGIDLWLNAQQRVRPGA
jgi:hypothetical protein